MLGHSVWDGLLTEFSIRSDAMLEVCAARRRGECGECFMADRTEVDVILLAKKYIYIYRKKTVMLVNCVLRVT